MLFMELSGSQKKVVQQPEKAVEELLTHLGQLIGEQFLQELQKSKLNSEENKK